MDTRRWRSTTHEIAMVIVDSLAHPAEVPWRRAAAVVIVALISTRIQQRALRTPSASAEQRLNTPSIA